MDSAPSSSRPASAASSAHSSPHAYHHQLAYTAFDSHVPSTSLQISTASALTHDREPGEETAHPFRAPELHAGEHDESGTQSEDEPMPSIADAMTLGPGPHGGLTRPLTHQERELINHLDRLKFFLATAPSRWSADGPGDPHMLPIGHPSSAHPALNRFLLPNQEYVSCVLWGGLYHITGTDIVRALVFRFEAFGRPVRNMKKFEEGVFSDLRNLKPGVDACLEEPKVSVTLASAASLRNIIIAAGASWTGISLTLRSHTVALPRPAVQVPVYSHPEETEGLLLVRVGHVSVYDLNERLRNAQVLRTT